MTIRATLWAVLLFAGSAIADDSKPECDLHTQSPIVRILDAGLLDDKLTLAQRRAQAEALRAEADQGDALSNLLLGALLRAGNRRHGNPLARDSDQAASRFLYAAREGDSFALTELAQLHMDQRHWVEAMGWAQLAIAVGRATGNERRSGYAAEQLGALFRRLSKDDDAHAEARYRKLVTEHLQVIVAKIKEDQALCGGQIGYAHDALDRTMTLSTSATFAGISSFDSLFLAQIDASGNTIRRWLIDAVPRVQDGPKLGRVVDRIKFTPQDGGQEPRYGLIPVAMDFRRASIKTDGK